ncbi:MAG: 50S ribosomal protein L18 [Spirochaetota bacterium]|nr:50S ribosomal protein L18 [Spirochaetota bacterium]
MDNLKLKKKRYLRRRQSIKRKIIANRDRFRFCISKSNKYLYAQIIDDSKGHTLVSASTLEKEFSDLKNKGGIEAAKILGKNIAQRALSKSIKSVVFDRNGFLYHGKVKAIAESARENGLEF